MSSKYLMVLGTSARALGVLAKVFSRYISGPNDTDEDLCYRLAHLLWHSARPEDIRDSLVYLEPHLVKDLEKYIHLAILTDNAYMYEKLMSHRPDQATLCKGFSFKILQEYKHKITMQDIYTIVHYGSIYIFDEIGLEKTTTLSLLVCVCSIRRGVSLNLLVCDNARRQGLFHYKICGVCHPMPPLVMDETVKRLTSLN